MEKKTHKKRVRTRPKRPDEITLVGNQRIRRDNMDASKKRMENAIFANTMRATQMANQYQLELQRLDAAMYRLPPSMQRDAILANRGTLQGKYDKLSIA